jgi:murein DD-endopeptidase MepM/ murein hydrolase activator NlpD
MVEGCVCVGCKMRQDAGRGRWIAVSRIALVGLVGGVASACSTDTVRLSEPFANPFASSERVAGSPAPIEQAPQQVAALPTPAVQSQALPPVAGPRVASAPVTSGQGGYTAAGGTRITVSANDNLQMISQRYGVPPNAILQANGLSSANQVAAGSQIIIPVFSASATPTQVAATSPRTSAPVRLATPAPGPSQAQTRYRLVEGPKPAEKTPAPKVASGDEASKSRVRPGMMQTAKAAPAPKAAAVQPAPQQVAARIEPQPAKPAPVAVAAAPVKPAAPAPAVQSAPQPEVARAPTPEPEQTGAIGADFRWPARGRVIAGFGANGGNEGINIAVPEGTPVKATEAGTVTYSGSEVKGYGNLVLIRHDNGYVSAYAHNGSLNVKRGEKVKRGQVIATSGQTGNVTSPQLHFELRKGQSPVDPMTHLSN